MATKKSLFSKPKWAAQTISPIETDTPIFRQNVYEDVLEAKRKQEEKRLARQKQKEEEEEERRRKSESHDTQHDENDQPVKKQRISIESVQVDDDDDYDFNKQSQPGLESASSDGSLQGRRKSGSSPGPGPAPSRGGPTLCGSREKDKQSRKGVDVLSPSRSSRASTTADGDGDGDDDDDELAIVDVKPSSEPLPRLASKPKTQPPPSPPEDESDSDEPDWMKELKRQARAAARAKPAPEDPKPSPNPNLDTDRDTFSGTGPSSMTSPSPAPCDPEVTLRIKSLIPGCHELFIKRLASQSLSDVRKYYVSRFQIPPHRVDDVFFTWNDSKLFNSTTVRSILTQIRNKYGTKPDGSDISDGLIEIEAVTEDIYQHRLAQKQREKERQLREQNGEPAEPELDRDADDQAFVANSGLSAAPLAAESQQPQKSGTVIRLKPAPTSGLPEMALRVHPHTTVERIVRGYKKKMGVDVSVQIYLIFDGDALDADQTVADVEFEEDDVVDIGVRNPG